MQCPTHRFSIICQVLEDHTHKPLIQSSEILPMPAFNKTQSLGLFKYDFHQSNKPVQGKFVVRTPKAIRCLIRIGYFFIGSVLKTVTSIPPGVVLERAICFRKTTRTVLRVILSGWRAPNDALSLLIAY